MGVRGSLPAPLDNGEYRRNIKKILMIAVSKGIKSEDQIDKFINELPECLQYELGGNTTCATVTSNKGRCIILDAGTGIRLVGDKLIQGVCGKGKGVVEEYKSKNKRLRLLIVG